MSNRQIRDVSLYVKVMGQGYPLVLMHGGPGLDHTSLLALQPLADQFTLIFYDHRCNGRSEGAEISSMTFENLTADAEALRLSVQGASGVSGGEGRQDDQRVGERIRRAWELGKSMEAAAALQRRLCVRGAR